MKTLKQIGNFALVLAFIALGLGTSMQAQQDVITTFAGGGPNGIPAVNANLNYPAAVATDTAGNVYVAAALEHRIFKIGTSGTITVVAGTGIAGYAGDGEAATSALLNSPTGVAVDTASPANVYISDTANCLLRKVAGQTGIITTIAGLVNHPTTGNPYPSCGFGGDGGAANAATLHQPLGLIINPINNDIYVADQFNGRIRKIAGGLPTGTITSFAGGGSADNGGNCGGSSPYGDGGLASQSYLCYPQSIALDTTVTPANVFITDAGRCAIREVIGSTGTILRIAGIYGSCGFIDNVSALSAKINGPWQIIASVNGSTTTLTFTDRSNARVRQFPLTYSGGVPQPGTISTTIGIGNGGYCGDNGPALNACLDPVGLAYDNAGNAYIGTTNNNRVRKVTKSTGYISTVAGWGYNGNTITSYSDPASLGTVPATGLSLYFPSTVTVIPGTAHLFIGGNGTPAVYEVNTASGQAATFAGNGVPGFAGDGTAANGTGTQLNLPQDVVSDSQGNIYIADDNNCAIREVSASTGDITTIAGGTAGHLNGCGFAGDGGPATSARLYYPDSIAIDSAENLYVSEYGNCIIRKITLSSGVITTIAGGTPGHLNGCGYNGDNGLAANTQLSGLQGVAVDGAGNVYISDEGNQRIRMVDALFGTITTIAGNGYAGYTGDGVATENRLYNPLRIYSDANGNIFFADQANNLLRWVDPAGTLITFAGLPPNSPGGNYNYTGDGGLATAATFRTPSGITQDNQGNFYAGDSNNGVVRKVTAFSGYGRSAGRVSFDEPQAVGTTSGPIPIVLSAIGPTNFSKISVSGPFTEIDDCAGASLTAGQTCEVDVYFAPFKGGSATGLVTIASDAFFPNQGNTVELEGTGAGLSIVGSLAFGNQLTGASTTKTVTLLNTGSLTRMQSISLTSTTSYRITGGTCPLSGGTLGANQSCTLTLTFSTIYPGSKLDTLVVRSSDPGSPLLTPITGVSVPITVTPASLAFGTVTAGQTSNLSVTVKNAGNTGSIVLTPAISGAGFTVLASGNTCATLPVSGLAPGASCIVPVQFAPVAVSSYSGTLNLTATPGTNSAVALTGAGGGPSAQLSATSIAFGNLPFANTSTAHITVTNNGTAALTISTAISGSGSAAFSVPTSGNTCTSSVAPGGSCSLPVHWAASALGSYSATLTLTTNGTTNPTVALSGTSVPALQASATSLAFGTITHGTSKSASITLTNIGNLTVKLNPTIAGSGAAAYSVATTGNTCGTAVAAKSSCTLPVTFTPAAAQAYSATLTVFSNGGVNPAVALTGTGN